MVRCLFSLFMLLATGADAEPPPPVDERDTLATARQSQPALDGAAIIARAHAAAGGEHFVRPDTLFLSGYNIIRPAEGGEVLWDHYAMWREFAEEKADAHEASGRVRIEGWTGSELALLLSYDGETTYDAGGPMADQSANAMWSNNFGFGAIRNALDPGWQQERTPDDFIDGEPVFMIRLTDPAGSETLFGVRQKDYAVVYVGFDTPRGWHERRYSHFFSKPGSDWVQAGRVRLFYNGIKKNEAIWTDYRVGEPLPPDLFRVATPPTAPTW